MNTPAGRTSPRTSPGHDPLRGGLRFSAKLVAWVAAAWAIWPGWIAAPVTVLCLAVLAAEQPRWRSLLRWRPAATPATMTPLEG